MKCAVCSVLDSKPSTDGYSDRDVHGAVASFAIGALKGTDEVSSEQG